MKRNLRGALAAFYLLVFSAGVFGQTAKGPYLQNVTEKSIIICWYTETPEPTHVLYGNSAEYNSQFLDSVPKTRHRAELTGLSPATKYHYRLKGTGQNDARDFTFRTAVPRGVPFSFLAFGDTRSNHQAHLSVVKQMLRTNPSFILHVGDVVAKGSKQSDWDEYFKVTGERSWITAQVPYFYALGNHEGNHANYYEYFDLPRNNPENTEQYYSFEYGDAHIICLNTETDFNPGSAQYAWLQNDLASAASSRWRVVFFHRPPYSSSSHGSSMKVRDALCPLFEQNKVHLVFSGHDHDYERSVPIDGVTYVVSGAGGAPLYTPKGESWTAFKASVYGFCKIDVTKEKLACSFITADGNNLDTFEIRGK